MRMLIQLPRVHFHNFVSLISQFDSFLSSLLSVLFEIKPEFVDTFDRKLDLSQITNLGSIPKARKYIIEKEIEGVLRGSHEEHFQYLENKLRISLRKDLTAWPTFIEITERRNLLVHCDGVVSSQYISVCKKNNCLGLFGLTHFLKPLIFE